MSKSPVIASREIRRDDMKQSKLAKVLCAGITGVMMISAITACNKTEETTTAEETAAETSEETTAATAAASAGEATEATAAAETEATTEEAGSKFTLPDKYVFDGDFELQVVGYEFFETGEKYDYDILNVYYDFTSLSDRFSKVNAISWTATQNGEEQKFNPSSNSTFSNMDFNDNIWLYLQKGTTLRGMATFSAVKGSKDVITVGIGPSSNELQYFDVDPNWEMPDIRHEDFEIKKVPNPSFGPGGLTEGDSPDGKFSIKVNEVTGVFTGTDLDRDSNIVDHKVIGISYTWTNTCGKEDNAFMVTSGSCYVFQDGISLNTTGSPKGSEDAGKTQNDLPEYEKIADGDTITFTAYYKLRSDSPIEIVYRDFMTQEVFIDVVYEIPAA